MLEALSDARKGQNVPRILWRLERLRGLIRMELGTILIAGVAIRNLVQEGVFAAGGPKRGARRPKAARPAAPDSHKRDFPQRSAMNRGATMPGGIASRLQKF